jgi:hypothetical protein
MAVVVNKDLGAQNFLISPQLMLKIVPTIAYYYYSHNSTKNGSNGEAAEQTDRIG